MQKLEIEGGTRLSGEIKVQGAKNSALPLLAATILCNDKVNLSNCPELSDVYAACRILAHLGCPCQKNKDCVTVDTSNMNEYSISEELMREMRSSIVFLGPIIGRMGKCKVTFPGGCELGPRPIDMHLSALKQMGVEIHDEHGILDCYVPNRLKGAKITFFFPSVGATENIMLAAVLAKGKTTIINAAREPEIVDIAEFLNKCGADIKGAGESTIEINGVEKLSGCDYSVMPDRIVACTYIAAAAITHGELNITDIRLKDIDSVTHVFEQMGCDIYPYEDKLFVKATKPLKAYKNIITMPYPGFPTDAQAIIMAPLCIANGTSVFVENIFENRYKHAGELTRMGANIKVEGKVAVVEGVKKLYGASVQATDLRGGAAMVIAALAAEGKTSVGEIKHIDRGYEFIEDNLSSIGAKIKRIQSI